MNRSAGVTAVATVAILEGLLACLFGVFALFGMAMMQTIPQRPEMPTSPVALQAILGIEALLFIGIGGWTMASAFGLLRLKNWARISICVLGGLLAVFSFFGLLGAGMMTMMPMPSPPGREVPTGIMSAVAWIMATICFVQMAVGIWWLVFLNRRAVKEQFLSGEAAPAGSERPLSITIIAWLMVIGGAFTVPFSLFQKYPALVFGLTIEGWAGKAFYLIYGLLYLGAGIELLRMRPYSLTLAVWIQIFGLANGASLLLPGVLSRYQSTLQASLPKEQQWSMEAMSRFMWFGVCFGLLFAAVQLWFLLTRKEKFLAAANRAQSNLPAA